METVETMTEYFLADGTQVDELPEEEEEDEVEVEEPEEMETPEQPAEEESTEPAKEEVKKDLMISRIPMKERILLASF